MVNKHLDKIINNNNLVRLVTGKNKSQKIESSFVNRYYICKLKPKELLKLLEYNQ